MATRRIHITKFDKARLEELIAVAEDFSDSGRKYLESLAGELAKAILVSSEEAPPDVVTMNSKVVLRDLATNEKIVYVLVFPRDANVEEGAISVLAPLAAR